MENRAARIRILLKEAHSEATKLYEEVDSDSTREIMQYIEAALEAVKAYKPISRR